MKHIFTILCFVFTFTLSAQEICNNGIDDDGDLLIDLNDTVDCSCASGTPPPVVSIIPNPSFEQRTCCPNDLVQFNCVNNWVETVDGSTPDYFNNCNNFSSSINTTGLNVFPDGLGCAGVVATSDYKEYISSCLSSPMLAGNAYVLKFNVASLTTDPYLDACPGGFNFNFGALDLTIFGNASCSKLTVSTAGTYSCPSLVDTSWVPLGNVTYSPSTSWSTMTITFTPSININAISFGPPCNLPVSYPPVSLSPNDCLPYFLFDNLTLNTSEKVSLVDIKPTGHYCTNNLVLKADLVTGISSGATLQWYHNGVAIVGQTSTTYSVPAGIAGTGSYQVQVSNGGSCVLSPIHQVTSTVPVISVYNPTICPTTAYTLLATCPVINTFTWSTGAVSNTISAGPPTTTVYTVSGTYGSCISQTTPTVTVMWGTSNPLSITATTLTACPGTTVGLSANNPGGVNSWTDGGHGYFVGSTSGLSAVIKPFSTVTYTLNSIFQNPVGAACQMKAMVTVSVIPSSVSVTPNNIKICPGRSITLSATGASSYTWNNGATSNTILITPTVNTTYTVTGNDGVCTVTNTAFIRADSSITVSINFTYFNLCLGNSKTFIASGASSYTWSTGSNSNQITVSPTVPTTYSVTGASGYCTGQASVPVYIIDPSAFSVTANTLICAGQGTTLTPVIPGTVTLNYHAVKGPGINTTFTGPGFAVTPSVTTTYTIVTYLSGVSAACTPSSVITVSVVAQPPVSVNSPTICAGEPAVLLATGASGYVWNTGEITNTVSVAPVITSTYNVTGTTPGCAAGAAQTSTVFVNPLPAVSLNAIPVLCDDSPPYILSGSPATGTFTGAGVVSNSSFDPSVSGTGTFTVDYSYTDVNGCENSAAQTVTVSICTGIAESEMAVSFSISPNPVNSTLSILTNADYISIQIVNVMGQIILRADNKPDNISVSHLSNGVYFIQLLDKNDRVLKTAKFIKD